MKEEIIANIDLVGYMQTRGVDIVGNENIRCPMPKHDDNTPSFSVNVAEQYYNCFGCDTGGNVINFIMDYDEVGFIEAMKKAADYAGYALQDVLSKEDAIKFEEKQLLKEIYKDAAKYMNEQLPDDLREHLKDHYGFEDDFIDHKLVGFDDGNLYAYLLKEGWEKEQILKTGLFYYKDNWKKSAFEKRIVFWYWKRGFPVYAIARKCKYTEDNEYEKAKYKKLLIHRKDRDYVSKYVKNGCIYNEDICLNSSDRPDYIVITEGITDAMLAEQMGIPVISPVTVRFRKDDLPKLKNLTEYIDNVYIINDNEDGDKGLEGALDTAEFLNSEGKNVYISILPKDNEESKIDLNQFLQKVSKEEFESFINNSKTYLDFILDEALEYKEKDNFAKMQKKIDKALYETRNMKSMMRDRIFEKISDKLDVGKTVIKKQFKEIKKEEETKPEYRESEEYYGEILEKAKEQNSEAHQLFKLLQERGAKFFKTSRCDVNMIYEGEFFEIKTEDCPFTLFLANELNINAMKYKNKQMLFEFKAKAIKHATKIKKQTWLYCDKYNEEIYFAVGYDNPYIFKITPDEITKVYNGEHKGIFVEPPDDTLTPWEFNPKVDEKKTALEMYDLFRKYIPFKEQSALFFLFCCMCAPLKRYTDTDPIIKLHGETSAGKTQAAKLVSGIWYEDTDSSIGAMTTASMYDQGSKRPFIFLDNLENLTEEQILFLIYSTSNAAKEKRVLNSNSGTIKQKVDSLVIVTAIEPFDKTELLNRSIDFYADKKYHCNEKAIAVVNDEAMENRDRYLSLWIQLIQSCLAKREEVRSKVTIIDKTIEDEFKERLNSFYGLAWQLGEEFLTRMGWSEDEVQNLILSELKEQAAYGSQTEKTTSVLVGYFETLLNYIRKEKHLDLDLMFNDIDDKNPRNIKFWCTANQLLNIFRKIARDLGDRFEYTNAQQLMARLNNNIDLLEDNGWEITKKVKVNGGANVHKFVYNSENKKSPHDWAK